VSREEKPQTLLEAIRFFADPDVCVQYVAKTRWPDGPTCPRCESKEHSYLSARRVWKCKSCKKQYSVKVGTIFEDSAIPLDKWLTAIWLIVNSKNGISSYELGRAIGLSQKSSWFVLHRIRLAMQVGSIVNWEGEVEVDETYIGGKARNMHRADRERRMKGKKAGSAAMTPVAAVLERGGRVSAAVLPGAPSRRIMHRYIRKHVEEGATVYTDSLRSYSGLEEYGFTHRTVDHAQQYVDGRIHTNGLENFFSLLKRGLIGTYVCARPFHLFRYLDERCFTYNERDSDDLGRFEKALRGAIGRRLTWAELTAKPS
jgi:transposase-like protein